MKASINRIIKIIDLSVTICLRKEKSFTRLKPSVPTKCKFCKILDRDK